ncbi:exported hypothetical protein [Gammaproteobacteria bacterium]
MHSLSIVIAKTTLLLSCLVSVPSSAEQFYRWIDKTGQVTFSDSAIPPSPNHHLEETQSYTPPSPQSQEQGLQRLKEFRTYNREHPLSFIVNNRSGTTPSRAECEDAMHHYEIESNSLTSTHASIKVAEAQMRMKCHQSERKSRLRDNDHRWTRHR